MYTGSSGSFGLKHKTFVMGERCVRWCWVCFATEAFLCEKRTCLVIEQTVVCPAVNKKFLSTGLCSSDQGMPHLNLIITLPYATLADTLTCFLGNVVVHIKWFHVKVIWNCQIMECSQLVNNINSFLIHPCSYLGDVNLLVMNWVRLDI